MPNGKVFCVPCNSATARIYDPVTDTLTTPTGTYTARDFVGGVLMPNGKVFCVPYMSTKAKIYDPVTDTLTEAGGSYPGKGGFWGGVLMPNGKVFCVPFTSTTAIITSTTALIYDPVTNTTTTPPGLYPGGGAFMGGVLMPNGKVFCVPHSISITAARIYSIINVYDSVELDINFVCSPFINKF
jgi:hypothetical protein